jgi:hypothetical protein
MKYMRVNISGQFLVNLSIEGVILDAICSKGLPEGTKFAYSIPNTHNGIWLIVEHDSFRELENGELIPEYPVIEFNQGV